MNLIVQTSDVRQYLELNQPGSTSKYSDQTIGSNIRAAQSMLEHRCHRFFYDHPAITWRKTTMLQPTVALPGFRTISTVTWGGAQMTVGYDQSSSGANVWALQEQHPGVEDAKLLYTALQFRAYRVDNDRPWWLADPNWWDKDLDNPFFPGNYAGGYAWTSMPNDLIVTGDGGYASGTEPWIVQHTVKVLAAWFTMRPDSILAAVGITPGGGVLDYTGWPPEVVDFIQDWRIGEQAVSVG